MHITLIKRQKVVEKFVKKVYIEKHSFIEFAYVVGAHRNYLNEAIPMCTNNIYYYTEIKETYFEIYYHCLANCLHLHKSYITKFDFMNFAFAKLLLARL